jgi:hypothetical protein
MIDDDVTKFILNSETHNAPNLAAAGDGIFCAFGFAIFFYS